MSAIVVNSLVMRSSTITHSHYMSDYGAVTTPSLFKFLQVWLRPSRDSVSFQQPHLTLVCSLCVLSLLCSIAMGHMRAIKRPSTSTYDPYSIDRVCEALLLICRHFSFGHTQHLRWLLLPCYTSFWWCVSRLYHSGVDTANRTQ